MKLTANKIGSILRQHGYKLTPQRHAVLDVITDNSGHLTPLAIYQKLRQRHHNIGLVTIYRTLELLAELKLTCRIHQGGNCRSYLMRRSSEHHHQLICSDCGDIIDSTTCELRELEQKLTQETGFAMEGHLLEFYGRRENCQKII